MSMTINLERLKKDILELSEIGRLEDHGIYRMAFTQANMEARSWLLDRIHCAGLESYQDGAGNIFGRLNWNTDRPSVMAGSHIDTVPAAGHLDGSLGVLVALECFRCIKEQSVKTKYPLEMAAFSDEEGRFGGLLGSEAVTGNINPARLHSAVDLNGVRLIDAMASVGLNAMDALDARRPPESIYGYLELHIEQGPVLDHLGYNIGVVEDITGLFNWVVRFTGAADHAGTTPMNMRKDAFMGVTALANKIPRILKESGSERSVATIGKLNLIPGTANTVPGQAEFALDVRDTDTDTLQKLGVAFRETLSAIARERSLMFEFDIKSNVAPVKCDDAIVKTLVRTAESLGARFLRMPSGAAHDAQIISHIAPVGMIFVPSRDGRSHSPAEWTAWEDIEIGAKLMLNALLEIAQVN